jgi:hypothetical protein
MNTVIFITNLPHLCIKSAKYVAHNITYKFPSIFAKLVPINTKDYSKHTQRLSQMDTRVRIYTMWEFTDMAVIMDYGMIVICDNGVRRRDSTRAMR